MTEMLFEYYRVIMRSEYRTFGSITCYILTFG